MKYVIVLLIVLVIAFFAGLVLGMVASDEYDALDDKEQEEYLRKWAEKHGKRS